VSRRGPAPQGVAVQIFGRRDSRPTQRALRFFKERRVPVSLVDVAVKPPAPTELRRFAQHLGAASLVDTAGHRYTDLGLAYLRMSDDELLERLLGDPGLLALPLVRRGEAFAAGPDEGRWQAMVRPTA
jgi:arsenate reductase (glutaredoxin)